MPRFTRWEAAPDEALREAEAWLRARLEVERAARGLAKAVEWSVEPGRREAGPAGGPQLAQRGFRILLVDGPTGTRRELPCFVAVEDIQDDEQQEVVIQVLGLWLDRVLEGA